jgi:hypothetical protein
MSEITPQKKDPKVLVLAFGISYYTVAIVVDVDTVATCSTVTGQSSNVSTVVPGLAKVLSIIVST